jgi:hypothetical protein
MLGPRSLFFATHAALLVANGTIVALASGNGALSLGLGSVVLGVALHAAAALRRGPAERGLLRIILAVLSSALGWLALSWLCACFSAPEVMLAGLALALPLGTLSSALLALLRLYPFTHRAGQR